MMNLTLNAAQTIVTEGLAHAHAAKMKPLSIVVLDSRAVPIAVATEDGCSLGRFDIARGKAMGALNFGVGSRSLAKFAAERPAFIAGVTHSVGELIPGPGGVLIRDTDNTMIGAVGISGDTGDNDELAAIAGISAAGLTADGG
ncbi:MAG: heme-binding protein [Deltaproteobacteria bacterium]